MFSFLYWSHLSVVPTSASDLQSYTSLHSLQAAHSLYPRSSLPSWSNSQHRWLCPNHRWVCPAVHLSLGFDSWHLWYQHTPPEMCFIDFRSPLWGMRIWKRINSSIDYSLKGGYVIMGHGILYETLEKAVDAEVLLQVFGRLSSTLQTKQQLGAVSVFLHPV